MPDSFVIRPAQLADSEGIARVHTSSWQSAYRGLLPDEWLDVLRWEDRKLRWDAILSGASKGKSYVAANDQNEIVGFASIGPSRDEDTSPEETFELYAIYVSPDYWQAGIGSALFFSMAEEIPTNIAWFSLWVLKDNIRGRSFYERRGFELDGATKMADIDGHQLEEVRYRIPLPIRQEN